MAEITTHTPGTFSWVELATTDQKAAVNFYRSLLGWEANDQPIGPDDVYTMFMMRGQEVAAAYTMRKEERQAGVPPHWNLYITVKSADDAVKHAEKLGGKVLAPAFDVMDAGRMATLQDPSGAVFCVWEPKKHIGAKIVRELGALTWAELTTRDTKAAEAFYVGMFGWNAKHSAPAAVMDYTEFNEQAGMMAMPDGVPAHVPSYWMPYFQVADCDGSVEQAKQLGATLMIGPQDVSKTGRFAIMQDPQGAIFAVFKYTQA